MENEKIYPLEQLSNTENAPFAVTLKFSQDVYNSILQSPTPEMSIFFNDKDVKFVIKEKEYNIKNIPIEPNKPIELLYQHGDKFKEIAQIKKKLEFAAQMTLGTRQRIQNTQSAIAEEKNKTSIKEWPQKEHTKKGALKRISPTRENTQPAKKKKVSNLLEIEPVNNQKLNENRGQEKINVDKKDVIEYLATGPKSIQEIQEEFNLGDKAHILVKCILRDQNVASFDDVIKKWRLNKEFRPASYKEDQLALKPIDRQKLIDFLSLDERSVNAIEEEFNVESSQFVSTLQEVATLTNNYKWKLKDEYRPKQESTRRRKESTSAIDSKRNSENSKSQTKSSSSTASSKSKDIGDANEKDTRKRQERSSSSKTLEKDRSNNYSDSRNKSDRMERESNNREKSTTKSVDTKEERKVASSKSNVSASSAHTDIQNYLNKKGEFERDYKRHLEYATELRTIRDRILSKGDDFIRNSRSDSRSSLSVDIQCLYDEFKQKKVEYEKLHHSLNEKKNILEKLTDSILKTHAAM